MEELLIIILQFVGEILFQSLFFWPFDAAVYRKESKSEIPVNAIAISGLGLLLGSIIGTIATYFFPFTFLNASWLRIINLVLAPTCIGLVSFFLAKRVFSKRRIGVNPNLHFFFAFFFSLAFVLVRFIYAKRF